MNDDSTPRPGPADEVGRRIDELSPAKRALLAQQLQARAAARAYEIPRRGEAGAAPASFAQELLWRLDRSAPGLAAYNASRALRLRGPLDVAALQRALDALVERHEALRTTFEGGDGEPRQVVRPPAPVAIERLDLRGMPEATRLEEAERRIGELSRRPFDLEREPQFRVALLALGDEDHVLFYASHHIALDGWSFTILFGELAALYGGFRRGTPVALPPLPVTFGDYAAWQRTWLSGGRLDALLDYWRGRLADAPEQLALPTDRPRPATPGFEGGQHSVVLPPAEVARLRRLAQETDGTLYTVLVAAYVALLARYTGQTDLVIGSPVAGRTRAETEGLVGYLANTLALRVDLGGDPTFAELVARVRETWLGAAEHQEIPLEKLVMELSRDRQLAQAPLFQCALTMEDPPPTPVVVEGLVVESMELDSRFAGSAKFDLLLLVAERVDGLRLLVQYRADLFQGETAERMLGHLRTLLESAVEGAGKRVSELEVLTEGEWVELEGWGVGAGTGPNPNAAAAAAGAAAGAGARAAGSAERGLVHERVSAWARRTPDAPALVDGVERLSYAELEARANRVARRLRGLGVGPGAVVGLALERSAEAVVSLLGVLKAGAAYLPLPPELPGARLALLVGEAGVRVVVSRAEHLLRLPGSGVEVLCLDRDAAAIAAEAASAPEALSVGPEGLAYVLFTSGSTGVPKGVAVTHANLAGYVDAILERLGWDAGEARSFGWV
ncbi:MAG TPA: condensation domain-containing protein, partial [Longimicrobiales bacterium]|nr:condensation domain-containing protein [Longimicrobiales bacterium]